MESVQNAAKASGKGAAGHLTLLPECSKSLRRRRREAFEARLLPPECSKMVNATFSRARSPCRWLGSADITSLIYLIIYIYIVHTYTHTHIYIYINHQRFTSVSDPNYFPSVHPECSTDYCVIIDFPFDDLQFQLVISSSKKTYQKIQNPPRSWETSHTVWECPTARLILMAPKPWQLRH